LINILEAEKIKLRSVHLTELRDGIFYSDLVLVDESGQEQKVSSRPSDAVALAVRVEAPILARSELFDQAGIAIPEQGEDEIEKFKEFLDEISPEDFA
jgi:bifunctional DNase/RNase